MRASAAILAASALPLLAGCGLPPAVTLASYAIDGALLAATGKSSKDHALSAAMQEDCNMFRAVVGDEICQPYEPTDQARRALETMGPTEAYLMTVADGRIIRVAVDPTHETAQAEAATDGKTAESPLEGGVQDTSTHD